ncbi:hypothetical protein A2533_01390 [Candidatus Falkowbacteria bacterium RIFOXYD2_FULL_35_9]|uniref:GerMN domain-containing protein n=1 Tax=Candidatus Falkowbacteria bacterium RIFOXYC2_FULL_36_12 TaxID=1798002 RepID=A0A1F5T097_9BACT|nr:MAG: hypothetical protein A2300_01085 [Candidatus Falkowbacteria bacterium RIFOXYB2_FULL_35_7]OGF32339.1 MAG: hypothetical protein A2478_03385 [Candidatus Falkowbacteria bacterium RIFOXYC2_FULL_36_12]OGF33846.1 MAG: hypothetical protein A2223_00020 [Candidatus Falkowbacteria bacterium RIFOXYA2_FULL_35_8]OGF47257.1 MAG: hypothetical protein A2533_01390 [Candidatus Falkowbacteria bacterium RIFOXYD2_FULL_35_9]
MSEKIIYLIGGIIIGLILIVGAFFLFTNQDFFTADNDQQIEDEQDSTQDSTSDQDVETTDQPSDVDTDTPVNSDQPNNTNDQIVVLTPIVGATVSNPINFSGRARGTFFFEGSFPVSLRKPNGEVVASSFATAQGEWMTTEFVNFTGQLEFNYADIDDGRMNLVFTKDDPSGRALTSEDSKAVGIYIQDAPDTSKFSIYFQNDSIDEALNSCIDVYPVVRTRPFTQAIAKLAIETLLEGPDGLESESGYTSLLPTATLNTITLTNGTLYIDLRGNINDFNGGSCRTQAMKSQIINTAKQFPSVNTVIISVNGDTENIFQP